MFVRLGIVPLINTHASQYLVLYSNFFLLFISFPSPDFLEISGLPSMNQQIFEFSLGHIQLLVSLKYLIPYYEFISFKSRTTIFFPRLKLMPGLYLACLSTGIIVSSCCCTQTCARTRQKNLLYLVSVPLDIVASWLEFWHKYQ